MSILAEDNITITSQKTVGDNAAAYTDAAVEGLVPMTGHAEGSIANFEDLLIKDLVTDINPVQDLSGGNPSPTNICPISGHTEAKVYRTGKNLLPYPYQNTTKTANGITFTDNGDGTITVNGTATANAQFLLTSSLPNSEWVGRVINGSPSGSGLKVTAQVYGSPWTQFSVSRNGADSTITDSGYENIRFLLQVDSGKTVNNVVFKPMIRLSVESSTYEPYNCNTYTTSLGQTVYGGTLDVTTGVLTVDKIKISQTWGNFTNSTTLTNYVRRRCDFSTGLYKSSAVATSICNVAPYATGYSSDTLHFYIDTTVTTATRAWVYLPTGTSDSTTIEIVYTLDTPVEYYVEPTQIATLNGVNNIWSDTGNVYVDLVAIRDDSEKLEKVSKLAGDTAQYFWYTSTGTDTGAHITEVPQDEWSNSTSPNYHKGGNLLARSNGIAIRDGLNELATFSADGITMKDSEQNEIFDVSVRSGNITHILRYGYASSDGYGGVINLGRTIDTFTSISVTYHPSADPTDITTLDFYSLPISIALSDTDLYAFYVTQTNSSTLDISFYSKDSDGFGELVCDNITIVYTTTQITSEMNLGAYPDDTLAAPLRIGNGAAGSISNAFAVDWAGNGLFAGNDIRYGCNADSSGGTSLIRGERFNGYYLSDSTAFVVIDVYKVGRLVNILCQCQRTYGIQVGSNFFTGVTPRVPRPAMEYATGAGFYSQSVIGGFVSINSNDEVAVTVRNVAGQTVSANATVYCTITYVAEE